MKFFKSMKTSLWTLVLSAASVAALISCAAMQVPGGQDGGDFNVMSLLGDGGEGHHPGQRGRWGHHGLKMMLKDLNLTEAQQAELKALHEQTREKIKAKKPQMKAVKEKIKTAFLSDTFDQAALKTEIQNLVGEHKGEHVETMADTLIKAYAILTPEQRNQLQAKLEKMEARIQAFMNSPLAQMNKDKVPPHLEKMANELGLTAAQREVFKSHFAERKGDFKSRFAAMQQVKAAVLQELNSGQATVASLSAILQPVAEKMGGHLDKRLDFMALAHQTLTADQRKQLVEKMEAMRHHKRGHKHRRGPHQSR